MTDPLLIVEDYRAMSQWQVEANKAVFEICIIYAEPVSVSVHGQNDMFHPMMIKTEQHFKLDYDDLHPFVRWFTLNC